VTRCKEMPKPKTQVQTRRVGLEIPGPGGEVFLIEDRIGAGSFGETYRAVGQKNKTTVAVKMVSQDKLNLPPTLSVKTILNEVRLAMMDVNHPNVVRVLHVDNGSIGEIGPFLMMEYVTGGTLQELIDQRKNDNKTFSLAEAVSLMKGIALGTQAINAQLVHRDIKPDNILIETSNGAPIPRIADFGIAKIVSDPTRPETFKGIQAVWYMAPEVWRQEKNTFKIDVYSAGLVFYQILTLQHPLLTNVSDPDDFIQWRQAHLTSVCHDVRSARPDVPLSIAKLMSWEEVLSVLVPQPTVAPTVVDPQLLAAMKSLADERFRNQQKNAEIISDRQRELERVHARQEEFRQSSRRLFSRFDEIIDALNQQDGVELIQISGDGILNRVYSLPNGRRVVSNMFGFNPNMEKPALGGGYIGVDGGLSANLLLVGQLDDIACAGWSAIEVTVLAVLFGDARLKWYREAGLSDATIRFVEHMDGHQPWRRDLPSFFGFSRADSFYEHYARGKRAMHVYSFSTRPDVMETFNTILRIGLRMPER
jgi:serine/threonine protein kinase